MGRHRGRTLSSFVVYSSIAGCIPRIMLPAGDQRQSPGVTLSVSILPQDTGPTAEQARQLSMCNLESLQCTPSGQLGQSDAGETA
jgi:hypothetical protein